MPDAHMFEIQSYSRGQFSSDTINAIREIPLTIYLNDREVVTLLCTGRNPKLLTVGFLKSDAFIQHPDQIKKIQIVDHDQRLIARVETSHDPWENRVLERSITSGCGKGTNFGRNLKTVSRRRINGDLKITPEQILSLTDELQRRSTLYCDTRGCHNSALCEPDDILVFHEDIGRHNAIDMICGHCFFNDISVDRKIIVTTGRVASEILMKIVRIGVPIIISTAVATSLTVELARKTGVTLIGKAKNDEFKIYNNAGRISGS